MVSDVYFKVQTPLGVTVRTTKDYWKTIVTVKHPSVRRYEAKAKEALKNPDKIRQSRKDPRVHLYYKSLGKIHICIVADHFSKKEGYIITAYLTDRIKEGEEIHVKN